MTTQKTRTISFFFFSFLPRIFKMCKRLISHEDGRYDHMWKRLLSLQSNLNVIENIELI